MQSYITEFYDVICNETTIEDCSNLQEKQILSVFSQFFDLVMPTNYFLNSSKLNFNI